MKIEYPILSNRGKRPADVDRKTWKVWLLLNRLARLRRADISPINDFSKWYLAQKRECFYCEIEEKDWIQLGSKMKTRLHFDRKDPKGGYLVNNICLACDICNRVKNNVFTCAEMKQIAQKYLIPKLKKTITVCSPLIPIV